VSDTTDEPNSGGVIRGPFDKHDDSILFMLSRGCATYPSKDLDMYHAVIEAMNSGTLKGFASDEPEDDS
jgi:hypothetical protein